MALTSRIEIRQGQALVMTPQLQQSIKLLQLNNIELTAFVESELEQNPLLERGENDQAASPDTDMPEHADAPAGDLEAADMALARADDMPSGAETADIDTTADDLWQGEAEVHHPGSGLGGSAGPTGRASQPERMVGDVLDNTADRPDSLREHLINQMAMEFDVAVERMIANRLIDELDEAGYLQATAGDIAEALGCDPALVEAVLHRMQTFDPPGVFARSLGECLALQLKDRNRYDPAMAALIDNLELMASGDLAALQQNCGVDDDDFAEMLQEIRQLNPKPGLEFEYEPTVAVIPDVFLRAGPDGGWIVELNNDTLPRVLVNSSYYAELSGSLGGKDREFVSTCFQNANWLVRSLDQRARTILKVAQELVRQQDGFVTRGIEAMRPLTLRDVADEIEMHESTVSRVCANKFMATPRGLFELRAFFSGSLASTSGGEGHAADAVRERIRQMIDAEAPSKVLSDDAIARSLSGSGIDIARRTVAKYREAMHIPSSTQRRREKAATRAAVAGNRA